MGVLKYKNENGVWDAVESPGAVKYVEQNLTDEQKAQSRTNIGAAEVDHTHDKADIGLDNVENKSSATIRGELTKENITDALGYTPLEKTDADANYYHTPSATSGIKIATGTGVDDLFVPTGTSSNTVAAGDHTHSEYLTSFTETDPTVPAWAKEANKPSYNKSEVGLGNVDNVRQYSADNPPPYPVTSVNGKTGDVTVTVPTKVSDLANDAGFITTYTDTNTTYDLAASKSSANGNVTIDLTGSDSSTDSITIKGSGVTTVTTDANGVVTIDSNGYDLPSAGASLGGVKTGGDVTITDGVISVNDNSHNHSADNITSGVLSLERLPSITSDKISSLDASKLTGEVPASILPSYVDDVIEGTYVSDTLFKDTSENVITGESGKIYVDVTTNKSYRWSGSKYVEISSSLALGENSSTAYYGDKGKAAYDHSQKTSGNPHNVTKSDVGLDKVENMSSADIRGEITKDNVTTALGYTPLDSYTETDPTVPAWAKAATKPTYTASEVGASPTGHKHTKSEITDFPTSMTPTAHTHSANDIAEAGYLTTHPELATTTTIPFIYNDLAFLTQKGGSITAYTTTSTDLTTETLEQGELNLSGSDKLFNGTPACAYLMTDGNYVAVLDLVLHKTFQYNNNFYIDFGLAQFRAKNISVYVMNKDTETSYTLKNSVTNNEASYIFCTLAHTSKDAAGKTVYGFNKMRIVLSGFNQSGSSYGRRLAEIGLVNYSSGGLTETFISRGGCDGIYGSLRPQTDNTAYLGGSAKRWLAVFASNFNGALKGNADTATALSKTCAIEKGGTGATTAEGARANLGVPTKVSDLNNDLGFITADGLSELGAGDMLKSVYDTDNNGKVDNADNADNLGGLPADDYLLKSGGTMTGELGIKQGGVGIQLGTSGNICATDTHSGGSTTRTILGAGIHWATDAATEDEMTVGHPSFHLAFRGSKDRPTYCKGSSKSGNTQLALIDDIPSKLPNNYSLKFGSKAYDGSSEQTITAADLGLEQAMRFLGSTTTAISDGSTTKTITVNSKSVTVNNGDVVLYNGYEFVWTGTAWEQLGQEGSFSLKTHTHEVTHTPAGTVSKPTFTGTEAGHTHSFSGSASHDHTFTGTAASHEHLFTGTGTLIKGTFTGTEQTASVSYTPAGTVSTPTITVTPNTTTVNSITAVGTLPSLTYTTVKPDNITAWSQGTLPSITYSEVEASKITAWDAGTAPSLTFTQGSLPSASLSGGSASLTGTMSGTDRSVANKYVTLSLSHSNPTLSFNAGELPTAKFSAGTVPSLTYTTVKPDNITAWSAGTLPSLTYSEVEASKITAWDAGTLPTKGSNTTVVTGIKSATSTQPTFTGTAATISHKHTPAGTIAITTGTPGSGETANYTPIGKISSISLTPSGTVGSKSVTISGTTGETKITPAGSVSQPTFTGTAATLTSSAANS